MDAPVEDGQMQVENSEFFETTDGQEGNVVDAPGTSGELPVEDIVQEVEDQQYQAENDFIQQQDDLAAYEQTEGAGDVEYHDQGIDAYNAAEENAVEEMPQETIIVIEPPKQISEAALQRKARQLELAAFANVVTAFRVHGDLSWQKAQLLEELRGMLHITAERHVAEMKRTEADPVLALIADVIRSGPTAEDLEEEAQDQQQLAGGGAGQQQGDTDSDNEFLQVFKAPPPESEAPTGRRPPTRGRRKRSPDGDADAPYIPSPPHHDSRDDDEVERHHNHHSHHHHHASNRFASRGNVGRGARVGSATRGRPYHARGGGGGGFGGQRFGGPRPMQPQLPDLPPPPPPVLPPMTFEDLAEAAEAAQAEISRLKSHQSMTRDPVELHRIKYELQKQNVKLDALMAKLGES